MSDRPAPALVLISPPAIGETTCIIREAGERQQWHRVTLDDDELDYYNLDTLRPGWAVWAHEGRFISDHTLRHLNWRMCPPGAQPAPVPAEEFELQLA
jgi:hypothetical protein